MTAEAAAKLPDVVCQLAEAKPAYFSVTHGAGGSDQDGTYETLLTVARSCGAEAAPHLTCIGSTKQKIGALLDRYREAGVKRIVALRGDLPATAYSSAARTGLTRKSSIPASIHRWRSRLPESAVSAMTRR